MLPSIAKYLCFEALASTHPHIGSMSNRSVRLVNVYHYQYSEEPYLIY